MSFVIVVRPDQLTQLRDRFPADMVLARNNIASRLQTDGQALVTSMLGRWKTGRLVSTLKTRVFGNSVVLMIGRGLKYTRAVFSGSPQHTITAKKRGGALSWSRFGQRFAYASVVHPGQPARTDILNALKALMVKITKEEVKAIIQVRSFG